MALKELIQDDMKTALLGGDRFAGNVLRDLKAAILNEEVAQGKRDEGLVDTEIEKIIAREVKKRNESVRLYEENDRSELAENEKNEIRVLEKYLPTQVSEDEIRNAANEIITDMDEPSMQRMGQVIGALKAKFGNSAEGSLVAKVVKEQLSNT
jgi:uncharacterized protein YqeY